MVVSREVPEDGPRMIGTNAQAPASAGGAPPADRAAGPQSAGSRYVRGEFRTAHWTLVTQIECPRAHHIKDGFIEFGHTTLRCSKCGVLMWALFAVHSHVAFVAEVDIEDIRQLKALGGLLPVLDYLGERTKGGRAA